MSLRRECRLCGAELTRTLVDLGMSPLCESYIAADQLDEIRGVLSAACPRYVRPCLLVQLPAYVSGEDIFSDYAYFSSYSDTWVAHARRYAEAMIDPARPDGTAAWSPRWPATTATCCSTSWPRRPGARHRARRERGRGGAGQGRPDGGRVLRCADGARSAASGTGRRTSSSANNVFAQVPDIRGFAAGLRALVKDAAWSPWSSRIWSG